MTETTVFTYRIWHVWHYKKRSNFRENKVAQSGAREKVKNFHLKIVMRKANGKHGPVPQVLSFYSYKMSVSYTQTEINIP